MSGYQQMRLLIRSSLSDVCYETCRHRNMIRPELIPEITKKVMNGAYYELEEDSGPKGEIEMNVLMTSLLERQSGKSIKQLEGKYEMDTHKQIAFQQFAEVIVTVYSFMESRFTESKLKTVFKLLDTDNDGFIDIQQIIKLITVVSQPTTKSPLKTLKNTQVNEQNFSHHQTATKIKQTLIKILIKFDKDRDGYLNKQDILDILVSVLNETETEIEYALSVVLPPDASERVSLEEMTRFLLQKHCGELSIQRLHSMKLYQNWNQRIMNFQQFNKTLGIALGYFYCSIDTVELSEMFQEIDVDGDGFIGYKEYFEFLKSFFNDGEDALSSHYTKRFQGWLSEMSSKKLENVLINDAKAASAVLSTIFNETKDEVEFAHKNLFKLIIEPSTMSQKELKKMITFLHMAIIMLLRGHKSKTFKSWNNFQLSCQQFIDLIIDASEWAQISADTSTLHFVFNQLDTNKDRVITYKEYITFIKHSVGNKTSREVQEHLISLFMEEGSKPEATEILKSSLWSMLRQFFKSKLPSGMDTLQIEEANALISSMIRSENAEEDYIRWNYSRLDRNNDHQIDLEEFCSFVISHSAEVSLQRFHMKQGKGKNELSPEEFIFLVKDSFSYLHDLDSWDEVLVSVYHDMKQEEELSLTYKSFLGWIKKDLAT